MKNPRGTTGQEGHCPADRCASPFSPRRARRRDGDLKPHPLPDIILSWHQDPLDVKAHARNLGSSGRPEPSQCFRTLRLLQVSLYLFTPRPLLAKFLLFCFLQSKISALVQFETNDQLQIILVSESFFTIFTTELYFIALVSSKRERGRDLSCIFVYIEPGNNNKFTAQTHLAVTPQMECLLVDQYKCVNVNPIQRWAQKCLIGVSSYITIP